MKRGFILSMDAIIAVSLLLLVTVMLSSFSITYSAPQVKYQRFYFSGKDVVNLMEDTKLSAVSFLPSVSQYLAEGRLDENDLGRSILDVIGSLWAEGNESMAGNITKDFLNATLNSTSYGYEILIDGQSVYTTDPAADPDFRSRLSTVVSGYEKNRPVNGYIAKVFLSRLARTDYEYVYFGGYVGDGNITSNVTLPENANVTRVDMEMNVGNNFTLYINGNPSGTYVKSTGGNLTADQWLVCSTAVNPAYCGLFQGGNNTLNINFTSPQGNFIGGGFIKVTYRTEELSGSYSTTGNVTENHRFPGIRGVINLYSSFYVPGTLQNMSASLHYQSSYPVYLTLGNVTVFEDNITTERRINLSRDYIYQKIMNSTGMNVTRYMSNNTVPVRFGTRNMTYTEGLPGVADVMLITDRTSSMDACDVSATCSPGLCDASNPCHDRRDYVAQNADRAFINSLLNVSGNRVGLVGYGEKSSPLCDFRDLTGSNVTLQNRINDYSGQWCGFTCIACGIESATKLIMEEQTLYGLGRLEFENSTSYTVNRNNTNVTMNVSFNDSRLIKGRLTIFGKDLDFTNKNYMNCIYLNGRYLGRMCHPTAEGGEAGYHDCVYDLLPDWITGGKNNVTVTSGNYTSCVAASGSSDTWSFKDVRMTLWQYNNYTSNTSSYVNTSTLNVNGQRINYDSYINLPEISSGLPNPVDLDSGRINASSDNRFGPVAGAAVGWDWASSIYGYARNCTFYPGTFKQFTINFNQSGNKSCAYGTEVFIDAATYNAVVAGKNVSVSFYYNWFDNPDNPFSNPFSNTDEVWVKARWYSPTSGYHYLGSALDGSHTNGDGTNEIWAEDNPDKNFNKFFVQDVTPWIEGPGTYYLDFGGKLYGSTSAGKVGNMSFDDVAVGLYNPGNLTSSVGLSQNVSFNVSKDDYLKAARLTFNVKDVDPYFYNCIYLNGNFLTRVWHQQWSRDNEWQNVSFDLPVYKLFNGTNQLMFTGGTMEYEGTGGATEGGCLRTTAGSGEDPYLLFRNVNITLTKGNETNPYSRFKGMLVMSDGGANTKIGDCGYCDLVTSSQQAIDKACEAYSLYNISIYSVAFGTGADASAMQGIAACDDPSHYYSSSNASELMSIYSRIAQGFMNLSYAAQTVNITSNVFVNNTLYPDSGLEINYTSNIPPLDYGEISVTLESPRLSESTGGSLITDNTTGTKEGWFFIPSNTVVTSRVLDSKITSYSSQYWTDRLWVNSSSTGNWTRVFSLGNFSPDYTILGDPYIVYIPPNLLVPGKNNSVRLGTGLNPANGTGGSPDSRVIYTIAIKGISLEGYSDVFSKMSGSTVTVYYDNNGDNVYDGSAVVSIGPNPSDVFDPENDAIDNAFIKLLDRLNFISDPDYWSYGNGSSANPYDGVNQTNPIDMELSGELNFNYEFISEVSSLWGPALFEVRVWE